MYRSPRGRREGAEGVPGSISIQVEKQSFEIGCMTSPSADPVAHQWAQANKASFCGQLGRERRKDLA